MGPSLKWDVECAIRAGLPDLRRSLNYADLSFEGTEEEMVASLVEGIVDRVRITDKKPDPLPRHDECLECDALILVHEGRDSWDDPGGGSWTTHCDVCMERWPCPEANELDQEEVERLQARYLSLAANHSDDGPRIRDLRRLHRRLEAEGLLPTDE